MSDLVGQTLGKYRVDGLLGRGGMGEVYAATHVALGGRVAIKLMAQRFAEDVPAVERFFNEARAAAQLRHAGIAQVFDFDRLPDGRPYMVMELLEGESLGARLTRVSRLAADEAVPILCAVADAVGEAHRHGIVHRDLKPDNIYLLNQAGAKGAVKVLDFGIAKLQRDPGAGPETRTGVLMGTPQYMSPEQAFGRIKEIGPASDIYSLGVVAYRALAGAVPFESTDGEAFVDLALKHRDEAPPPLRARVPALPPALDDAVMRALAKAPAARFSTMADFAGALTAAIAPEGVAALPTRIVTDQADRADRVVAARAVAAQPPGASPPSTLSLGAGSMARAPASRRRRVGVGVGVLLLAGVTVLGAGLAIRARSCRPGGLATTTADAGANASGRADASDASVKGAWVRDDPPLVDTEIYAVWAASPTDLWIAGGNGTLAHEKDGKWSVSESGTPLDLFDVWGRGPNDVFAVGRGGTVLHFDGDGWEALQSGTDRLLHDTWSSPAGDVWIVGDVGVILHLPPGPPSSITAVDSGTTQELFGVWGSGPNDIYAVGHDGTVTHYDGASWTARAGAVGNHNRLLAITGSSPRDVWSSNAAGETFHYDGQTWSKVPSPVTTELEALAAVSPGEAWAAGQYGTVLRWDGVAWALVSSNTHAELQSLYAFSDGSILCAGYESTLLKHPQAGSQK
jgi:serine/threonine-protein kinase